MPLKPCNASRRAKPPVQADASCDGNAAVELYLRTIGTIKPLPPEAETELAARLRKGDKEARRDLIKANLHRVVDAARDYEDSGLGLLDLISEGNLGLITAIDRFDPAKERRLSACILPQIRHAIQRAIQECPLSQSNCQ